MQHDEIFAPPHPFSAPEATDDIPFFIADNPSKGYYFPIDVDDIQDVLHSYPKEEVDFITHIWLRKHLQKRPNSLLLAEFMTGSGVYLMTLYPLEKSNRHYFGEWEPIRRCFAIMKGLRIWVKTNTDGTPSSLLNWQEITIWKSFCRSVLRG